MAFRLNTHSVHVPCAYIVQSSYEVPLIKLEINEIICELICIIKFVKPMC